ncbi:MULTISPECIES: MarR family transcriptional regulator [unclassified Streptomyces]|uniref:MarR family winged helix-turn-helix transcriptional regulator n=1 Tax=unclassified Streptomyces TaxID=2593676 RepID=UPI0001C18B16|nr:MULTISPECIES: MarR family transcriptional regulator [unclassified Streptomyces]AEN08090.1 transcriptional regulator, MarR family [Streptomyces sp. SirexAA-E]MYR68405.1 MarR family transcriptional regulator [Streptomyces sp. SID4939]MYS02109.1 MarR family transcriptional regulator [Streptomyces sp. SID4940]MYT66760.1 MarR family transcriptional regulator [Streptomyces sp. SID8357]MYT83681.1 MarR family transcriptional regulator [Streptomyces sp. SID8360]
MPTDDSYDSSDDSTDALIDGLVRSAFQIMGVLTRIGAEHDLSLTQLRVLGILRDRRPRMSDLAAFLGLDKSTLSGLIDRAERRGLLARAANPDDKRVVDVLITDAGRELTGRLYEEVKDALAPATGRLDAAQRRQLTQLLEPVLTPPLPFTPRPAGRR